MIALPLPVAARLAAALTAALAQRCSYCYVTDGHHVQCPYF
ncbi:hypothetical protein AB0O05_05545 [Streptomyces sp. NPDC093084]